MSFKKFKDYAEAAKTRCGAAFEIVSVQQNMDGIVTAAKGLVYLPNEEDAEKPTAVDMLWNLKGQAMLIGEPFDLVVERLVSEVSDDAETLLSPEN